MNTIDGSLLNASIKCSALSQFSDAPYTFLCHVINLFRLCGAIVCTDIKTVSLEIRICCRNILARSMLCVWVYCSTKQRPHSPRFVLLQLKKLFRNNTIIQPFNFQKFIFRVTGADYKSVFFKSCVL